MRRIFWRPQTPRVTTITTMSVWCMCVCECKQQLAAILKLNKSTYNNKKR